MSAVPLEQWQPVVIAASAMVTVYFLPMLIGRLRRKTGPHHH